jgi:RNA polymerase primary sigma factor
MPAAAQGLGWWLDQVGRFPLLTPAEEIELATTIQAWRAEPAPSPALRRRGERAKRRFIEANLRLTIAFIRKHCHRLTKQLSVDDLVQAGNEGLITAVERFDPTRGYRFSTYAYWWIRQSITNWADRNGRVVAIPAIHSQHLGRLGAVAQRLERELERPPTRPELAAALGVSQRVLEAVLVNGLPVRSLDQVIGDDLELHGLVASHDPPLEQQEEDRQLRHRAALLHQLLDHLPASTRQIVAESYGLDGISRSRQEVAQRAGIGVRRLETILFNAEQQLGRMSLQLELVHVERVQLPQRLRLPRRRRLRCCPGQMLLWPAAA